MSLRTPVKVRADVNLGSRHSSTSVRVGTGGSSRSNNGTAVKVRVGTGNSSSHRSTSTVRSNRTYVQVQAHAKAVKAEGEKAERAEQGQGEGGREGQGGQGGEGEGREGEGAKAQQRQQALEVRADAALLKGLIPATRVLADGRVLDLPVRACVLVNTDGCDRTPDPTHTGTNPGAGDTGGGLGSSPLLTSVVTATATDVPVVGDLERLRPDQRHGLHHGHRHTGTGTGTGSTGTGSTGSTGTARRTSSSPRSSRRPPTCPSWAT